MTVSRFEPSFSASQTLINDWYGTSRWLAAFLKPASSVSGRRRVIDRVCRLQLREGRQPCLPRFDMHGPACEVCGSIAQGTERAMEFRIIVEPDEDGVFVATVPSLPGCVSQGATREEAHGNIREAIEGYVESLRERNEPIPPAIHEEVIDVAV